tara:strand:+ start:2 stop:841 length:840 start_codon:yes stop_codon:yes gene_type:complete
MLPKHLKKVKKYRDKTPLFFSEKIETKLYEIFKTEVKLLSGGYLVINPTEALISIDVNSGKSIKQKNVENTALDTNLEAAEEISRQIKIRDLSGLIIIDFIDMLSFNNKRTVERRLKDRCRKDRARIQIGRISNFGLLEMSRQRLRESNVKWQIKLTKESYALKILKLLELKSIENKAKVIEMKINESIKTFMEENLIENLNYFKNKNKLKINLEKNTNFDVSEYIIEFKSKNNKILEKIENISLLKNSLIIEKSDNKKILKFKKKNFYKKKFFKKKVK